MIIVLVSARGAVVAENGVKRDSFRFWPDRLEELNADDYEIVKCDINVEEGSTTYSLQKEVVVMDKWEYMTLVEGIRAELKNLNDWGLDGWELVSSVQYEIGGNKSVKHFLKRPLKPNSKNPSNFINEGP